MEDFNAFMENAGRSSERSTKCNFPHLLAIRLNRGRRHVFPGPIAAVAPGTVAGYRVVAQSRTEAWGVSAGSGLSGCLVGLIDAYPRRAP